MGIQIIKVDVVYIVTLCVVYRVDKLGKARFS